MRLTAALFTCVITLAGFSLISTGSQWLNEAQTFPEPTELTYAKFVQDTPLSGWFSVKGAYVNLADAAYLRVNFKNAEELARSRSHNRANGGAVTEAYLPLYLQKEYDLKANAVLLTHDATLLKPINELRALLRTGSDVEIETWLQKNQARLWNKKDFKGMVRPSRELDANTATLLRDSLADGFVLIEEGKEPSFTVGISVICSGILLLILLCTYWGRVYARGTSRAQQPPSTEEFEEETLN